MNTNLIPALVTGGIPFLGGLYATFLGFRWIGRTAGANFANDRRYETQLQWLKWGGPLLMAFGVFLFIQRISQPGVDSVEQQIEKSARAMNKRLPIQVDKYTRWNRVEPGPGKSFTCIFTVSKDLSDEDKTAMRESLTQRALADPDMEATFAADVTVWYKIYDISGKKMLEFSLNK